MHRLDADGRKLLLTAQRSWLAYRNAHCAFIASATEGGSAQPMIRAMCMEELTTQRNKELQDQLTCPEGDMSCVAPTH